MTSQVPTMVRRERTLLSKITFPQQLPPLIARILDDWRGMYSDCTIRPANWTAEEEDIRRCRAIAESFARSYEDHPLIELLEPESHVFSVYGSIVVRGLRRKLLFPYDLLIHESHDEVLPRVSRWLSKIRRERFRKPDFAAEFIDWLAFEFERMTIILKKNDVRIVRLLSTPSQLQELGNLFPQGEQIAKQLGLTSATGENRILRLHQINAIRLQYIPHPLALGRVTRIVEFEWPPTAEWQTCLEANASVAFQTSSTTGVAVDHATDIVFGPKTLAESEVRFYYSIWNLDQLDQWNRENFPSYTPFTGYHASEDDILRSPPVFEFGKAPPQLQEKDITLLRRLNDQQIDTADKKTRNRLTTLVKENQIKILPQFRHIGLDSEFHLYASSDAVDDLGGLQADLLTLPYASVVAGQDCLLGLVVLPNSWSHHFSVDLAELKQNIPIAHQVVTSSTLQRPWTFLIDQDLSLSASKV